MVKAHQLVKPVVFFLLLIISLPAVARRGRNAGIDVTTGTFRKWDYAPSTVFGIGLVSNTLNKYYYKISIISSDVVKVERYNPADIVLNKTLLYFSRGVIAKVKEFNQWGEEYSQTYFTKSGDNEFFVTKKTRGENSYLPCKKAKFIYKNNLLQEVRYFDDSGAVCTCGNGAAVIKYKRYEDSRRFSLLQETAYFDETGAPAISTTADCHKIVKYTPAQPRASHAAPAFFDRVIKIKAVISSPRPRPAIMPRKKSGMAT